MIDNHGAALYSDFFAYYHLNLSEVLFGSKESRIEPHFLLSLVENLPEGSALRAEIAGGEEFRPWDTKTYLLANIFNAINSNTLVLSNAPKTIRNKVVPITGPARDNSEQIEKRRAVGAFLRKFNIIE